jgi:hypothetical protein
MASIPPDNEANFEDAFAEMERGLNTIEEHFQ